MTIKKSNWTLMFIYISFIALIFGVSSCECRQIASGIVADKSTKRPINRVSIRNINGNFSEYSDSLGTFKLETLSGAPFGCPLMEVVLSKKNYRTITRQIGHEKDTVFLEKVIAN